MCVTRPPNIVNTCHSVNCKYGSSFICV